MPQAFSHGGARDGAGRKTGSGRFGEPTRPVRVPESLIPSVRDWLARMAEWPGSEIVQPFSTHPLPLALPLYSSRIQAGFPSPADDHLDDTLDLNDHLVQHPAATFLVRVAGDSMIGAGIYHDDLLVVDRSLEAKSGSIVVAVIDGDLTVKRLHQDESGVWLMPENPAFKPLQIREGMELVIWGVVAHSVRSHAKG
jgi:DNA polymerase V